MNLIKIASEALWTDVYDVRSQTLLQATSGGMTSFYRWLLTNLRVSDFIFLGYQKIQRMSDVIALYFSMKRILRVRLFVVVRRPLSSSGAVRPSSRRYRRPLSRETVGCRHAATGLDCTYREGRAHVPRISSRSA